jgi:hypothetical protein
MPRPVFIIAAARTSEDKTSGFLSLFEILEVLDVQLTRPEHGEGPELIQAVNRASLQATESTIVSVWLREEADAGQVFEHQFAIIFPDREDPLPIVPFQFADDLPLQRFKFLMRGFPMLPAAGIVEVESRVRLQNADTWARRQRYPLIFRPRIVEPAPAH